MPPPGDDQDDDDEDDQPPPGHQGGQGGQQQLAPPQLPHYPPRMRPIKRPAEEWMTTRNPDKLVFGNN